jgi:hypothetical protein
MGKEGRKEIWISKDRDPSTIMQRPKGSGPGGCGLVQINGPDGVTFECSGSCGFVDSFLGRSCVKVVQNEGGGVQVFCTCSGGWWDSIFGG